MAKSFDELVRRTTTKKTRDRAARRAQELLGKMLLRELRTLAGKSQRQVAEALGIKQPSLSKLEKQSDMQISTLRRIVQALGGQLNRRQRVFDLVRDSLGDLLPGGGLLRAEQLGEIGGVLLAAARLLVEAGELL